MHRFARTAILDFRTPRYVIAESISTNGTGPYFLDWRFHNKKLTAKSASGIVMTEARNGVLYENPVAIAFYALGQHAELLESGDATSWESFILHAEQLLKTQDQNGGWAYPVEVPRYNVKPGWYSAMAQGMALSVFVRAHYLTKSEKYREAIKRAANLLLLSTDQNGCSDYDAAGRPFLEECPSVPPSRVLNGAIFALWGLWEASSRIQGLPVAECCSRLADELPGFDLGYWSRYDLRFKAPATRAYHVLHISQLRIVASLSGDIRFLETAQRWETAQRSRRNRLRAAMSKAKFVWGRRDE